MKNEIFEYKGTPITFQIGNGEVMVNATEMAKPFGKRPVDFLQNQNTINFIKEYCDVKKSTSADLVKVIKGGNQKQGTWLHEDIALEFSRWLSPSFSIWCNYRIKEIMKYGFTATETKIDELIANPDLLISLATQLKEERLQKELYKQKTEIQENQLKLAGPKVEYYNQVLQSQSTYTTTLIAKELGKSATELNKILKANNIQYKQGDTWVLYARYQNFGYTKTKTFTSTDPQGNTITAMTTVWTELGRKKIHELIKLLNKNG